MFHPIAGFDIQQAFTAYAPYTARKIVIQLSNMVGIEQSFNITINYRDQNTNDPFSETYLVDQFPYSVAFTTNHTGNIILDSIESDYTGSGTCDAYLNEYEYTGSEDSVYNLVKSTTYVDSDTSNSPYYMPYDKHTSYGVLLHYYSGNTGDIIRVTTEGIKLSGERITEICYLRDTDDYIRLSEEFFVITNISTQKLSGSSTGGALQLRTAENIDTGAIIPMGGNPSISSNVGVNINTGYALSKPNSQVIFIGVYGNDNAVNEIITYTGTYDNGNISTTDNITMLPASQNSQIKLLLTPDIEFLDHFQMNSYSGSTGNFQWGILGLPALPPVNNPPYVYAGILNQTVPVDTITTLNIESGSEAFRDPDGDSLTYSVVSESNYGDATFISISERYITISPTNMQAGKTFNFTIRATDGGGLYAETAFNVEVTGGSQPEADRFIANIETGMLAFIIEETPTHYKAIGWYDGNTLSLQTIIEPTIELTGANVIMSKDYIAQHPLEFTVQELN